MDIRVMSPAKENSKNNRTRLPCGAVASTLLGSQGKIMVQHSVLVIDTPEKQTKHKQG